MKIGIISEYNPFHNGHLYQINEVKRLYNPDLLINITSGNFTQRGEFSSIDKFNKARIAVLNGIDLCVELPIIFAVQSADIFAYYSVFILNLLNVDMIVAGSEDDDLNKLNKIANLLDDSSFNITIKKYLDLGNSYKKSFNFALKDLNIEPLNSNDTLNVSYLRAIKKINPSIVFKTIKRTVPYDSSFITEKYASASYIRETKDFSNFVPKETLDYYNSFNFNNNSNYIDMFKYSILNNDLKNILGVSEGFENNLKKLLTNDFNIDDIVSKRYTKSRINRNLIMTLLNVKNQVLEKPDYVRVLSMNNLGKNHLNSLKHNIKIYTNIKDNINYYLDLELKGSKLYSLKSKINIFKFETNNPYILLTND